MSNSSSSRNEPTLDTPRTNGAILRTVNIYVPREDGSKRMVFEFVEAAVAREMERELIIQDAANDILERELAEARQRIALLSEMAKPPQRYSLENIGIHADNYQLVPEERADRGDWVRWEDVMHFYRQKA